VPGWPRESEEKRKSDFTAGLQQAEKSLGNEDWLDDGLRAAESAVKLAEGDAEATQSNGVLTKVEAALKARRDWAAVVEFTIDS
jgi:hypothetical protein